MSNMTVDKLKSGLPVALGIYPIFIGLYVAGLFWDVPKDAIGAFGIEDFLFRCSIIYVSLLAILLFPLLIAALFYSVIIPQNSEPSTLNDADRFLKWPTMTKAERIRVGLASLGIISLVVVTNYYDPPNIDSTPDGFVAVLLILFLLGMIGRPFIAETSLRVAAIMYAFSWLIAAPLIAGYSDSKPAGGNPKVKFHGSICNLVLIGKYAVLGRCAASFIVISRDKIERPLVWRDDP